MECNDSFHYLYFVFTQYTLQVVVAKETVGNLGGLIRQLSLDQFENESRRMIPSQNDMSYPTKKIIRQKSCEVLHKKVIYLYYTFFFSSYISFSLEKYWDI